MISGPEGLALAIRLVAVDRQPYAAVQFIYGQLIGLRTNLKRYPLTTYRHGATAVSALDKVVLEFRREGTEVEVLGLNEASATIVDRFGVHGKPDAIDKLMSH